MQLVMCSLLGQMLILESAPDLGNKMSSKNLTLVSNLLLSSGYREDKSVDLKIWTQIKILY